MAVENAHEFVTDGDEAGRREDPSSPGSPASEERGIKSSENSEISENIPTSNEQTDPSNNISTEMTVKNNVSNNADDKQDADEIVNVDDINNDQPIPKMSSFLISDILKPDFGRKKDSKPQYPLDLRYQNSTSLSQNHSAGYRQLQVHQPVQDSRNSHASSRVVPGKNEHPKQTHQSPEKAPDSPEEDGQASKKPALWPAWVYCTRYSDRPSSGPRARKMKIDRKKEEKRPRTAFTNEQLARLKKEFEINRYLTEHRRHTLSAELQLNESQIKIWFQNKRAKLKKSSGSNNALALELMAQGLYNHTTMRMDES